MDLTHRIQELITDNTDKISSGDAAQIAELIVELLIGDGYVENEDEDEVWG